ncbi:ExeM/NucH family extracellular endonuclease [Humibacillus xanthopallidus]|uniref:LTD domain-containing protein n=1 Tax=Humibacillus xanthopallidus TaxID=412689 RepID=A0A543HJA3_9MICO|nr:ExeM/NucH family extracellular endonuclease [Humibacillus xanthopallidus]TQM58422.1 hypothetical protein FBY41_3789 [Humibacillus xanthopallidus]
MLLSRPVLRRVAGATAAALAVGIVPLVAAAPTASAAPSELFISEYVEGSSNNKAIEIYNGTGAPIDLAAGGYRVQMFFNGGTAPGLTINLTGTVLSGDVFVVAPTNANATILSAADQTFGTAWFNGDDAVSLQKNGVSVDVIGQIGFDPGTEWGTGLTSTADNTLRRKASVTAGDPNGADAFDPVAQWDGYAADTFDGLGSHTVDSGSSEDLAPRVSASSPASGATGVAVTSSVSVTFSEPVTAPQEAFGLYCAALGDVDAVVSGGPTTFTVDPAADLVPGDRCFLTVSAAQVRDVDTIDPPDTMSDDAVISFTTTPAGDPCTLPYQRIPAVQGAGASVTTTNTVTTQGVVVADYEGPSPALRGFYIQDPTGDGDPQTSDGIFVFEGSNADTVKPGDVVRVTGRASENQEQSQISVGTVVACGTGSVAPTDVVFPVESKTFLERYEGMLVRLPQTMSVTEHFQLGRFGQVTLSQGGRLQQPTNVVSPGAPALALQAANDLRKIIVDDGSQAQNPDPILFARDGAPLTASNTLRGGDTATGVVGVMTYTWGGASASPNAYRVRPVGALGGTIDFEPANPRPTSVPDVGGTTRVAGMNLLNFFNTFSGCRSGVEGGATDCRGAENATEFDRQWRKTVAAVSGTKADVVAFMEMENDGYGPGSAVQFLVDRLNEKDGAGTWAFIDADKATGQTDALGDDAIKVGMLYKPGGVTPIGRTAVLNTVAFVNGGDQAPRNRPALAQAFRDNVTGGVFVGVANHLKSKGSACDEPDQNDGQANCSAVRTRSAALLADWLAGDPTGTGDPDVLILGDLNSYAKEDPITMLESKGFTNLIEKFNGAEAYSYAFDGQWGYLDHALGSASITAQTTAVRDWHINADEPNVLDYNTNFKSAGQVSSLYAPDEFRISDHDPVVVGLDLADDAAGFVTGGGFIQSPAGALVADPTRMGKGAFQIDLDYAVGATHPTGSFVYSLGGAGSAFSLAATSFDFLTIRGDAARFSGAATVNGAAGFTYTADVVDRGKADTFRLVVRAAGGSLVYDSGVQTAQGQITIHP